MWCHLVRINFLPLQMCPAFSLAGAYRREVGRVELVRDPLLL